ncbi:hypothetical protein DSM112329_01720 [Paraconexibacter sp. AEG42_29]|uniref:ABC transporter permease n=1 Tax=Paraconexibacter sp. AEG42_29 TaxID=2997339 RepID=A0AAU7ATR5_9ACTN
MASVATNPGGSAERPASVPAPAAPDGTVKALFREAGELAIFTFRTFGALRGALRYPAEIFRQSSILARGSTGVIAAMCFLIGFSAINFAYYFLRAAGAADYTGLFSGLATARAACPVMFGYVFAAKVGCGLVAEIGAMRISQEIDALESEAIDPMRYVVAVRLLAAMIFLPGAVFIGLLGMSAGCYLTAVDVVQGLSSSGFSRYHWAIQTVQDQLYALIMMGTMAISIVIVSCFYGWRTKGGPAEVGGSVARSLVVNLVLIHVIIGGFIFLFYGLDPKLPIGG